MCSSKFYLITFLQKIHILCVLKNSTWSHLVCSYRSRVAGCVENPSLWSPKLIFRIDINTDRYADTQINVNTRRTRHHVCLIMKSLLNGNIELSFSSIFAKNVKIDLAIRMQGYKMPLYFYWGGCYCQAGAMIIRTLTLQILSDFHKKKITESEIP